jgi:Transglutaminase-like superfamily
VALTKNSGLSLRNRTWEARDLISASDATGHTVLLHIPSGTYLRLDRGSARIVHLLSNDPDPEHAASALSDEYGISLDRALADVSAVRDAITSLSPSRTSRARRPTITGARSVVGAWRRQPLRSRQAIVEVTWVVIGIEIGLKLTNLATLSRLLGVPLATDDASPPEIAADDLSGLTPREQRLYWAVSWVMQRWLYDGTCLRRALTLGWFLRRREPTLRLGMMEKDGTIAHAWIEVAGQAFNAQPVTAAFSSTSTPCSPTGPARESEDDR